MTRVTLLGEDRTDARFEKGILFRCDHVCRRGVTQGGEEKEDFPAVIE